MEHTAIVSAGLGSLDVCMPGEHVIVKRLGRDSDKRHIGILELFLVFLQTSCGVGLDARNNLVSEHGAADLAAPSSSSESCVTLHFMYEM